jgi:hypothetical protein
MTERSTLGDAGGRGRDRCLKIRLEIKVCPEDTCVFEACFEKVRAFELGLFKNGTLQMSLTKVSAPEPSLYKSCALEVDVMQIKV